MRRTRELFRTAPQSLPASPAVFAAMCRDASEELECDLVSVWLFDPAKESITCVAALDAATDTISTGGVLLRRNYPTYFSHLLEETFIKAPDARRNQWTRELSADYFEPHGIVSMLDYILHDGSTPLGIICCERREPVEFWSDAQAAYLLKLTALAASYFMRSRTDRTDAHV
jgi:GAF domain-containing protein